MLNVRISIYLIVRIPVRICWTGLSVESASKVAELQKKWVTFELPSGKSTQLMNMAIDSCFSIEQGDFP